MTSFVTSTANCASPARPRHWGAACSGASTSANPGVSPLRGRTVATKAINEKQVVDGKYKFDADKPVKAGDLQKLEKEFIKAMQSFYYEGQCTMSEIEFLTLQEELLWSGSQVAILSDAEKVYLDACWAKQEGDPIMSDAQFQDVVRELQKQNSPIIAPRNPRKGPLSVSPGLMLAALAGLGALIGAYAFTVKSGSPPPAQPQATQTTATAVPKAAAPAKPASESNFVERLNFLRNKDETLALQNALADAQAKLVDAEKRVETMSARLEAGRSQIDALEASIATLSKEKIRLEGTQKEQDQYLVTLNDQLQALETQAEQQRLMLQSLTGPTGRMAELRARMESADSEVQRLKAQEAEMKAQRMEELSRLEKERDKIKVQTMEELARLRVEKEELAAKVEKETTRYRSEKEELEAEQERLRDQARARELALLSERDAIKATAEKQAKLLEMIAAPDGKIAALKSEVSRAEAAAAKLREEMASLQASLEAESASYAVSERKISDLEGKVQSATADAIQKAQQKAAIINDINAKVAAKAAQKAALENSLKEKEAEVAKAEAKAVEQAAASAAELSQAPKPAPEPPQQEPPRAAQAAPRPGQQDAPPPAAPPPPAAVSEAAEQSAAPAPAPEGEAPPPKPTRRVYGKYSRM